MPWIEKHRPKIVYDIKGQDLAIAKIKRFFAEFNNPRIKRKQKKALILYGPPGTGKTSLAHALANETNSEIFELNASDLRNKEKLKEILRPAMEQKSLMRKNKIIFIDEVDGISDADRGGLTELISLIQFSNYPIIITANDIWSKKLSSLRKISELIQLKEVNYSTIRDIMISILKKENLFVNNNILVDIATKSKGDVSAAINDLQTISKIKDPSTTIFDERNKEPDIFSILKKLFKDKPTNETLRLFDSLNMPID